VSDRYILDGHKPVRCTNLLEWAKWMETAPRRVSQTFVHGSNISTVFLGLDHSYMRAGDPPILFETLVFGGPLDGAQDRYSSWEEAEKGHVHMVERVRSSHE
jgi:hypothetical protein